MKTKKKKLVKTNKKKVVIKKEIEETFFKYRLEIKINGNEIKCLTNHLKDSILEMKPSEILTEAYITVKKDEDIIVRKLNLIQARKLFNDEIYLDIFINNLLV